MRDPETIGDTLCVVDILPGAAGASLLHRCAMVVELQCDAHHIIARLFQQGRSDG